MANDPVQRARETGAPIAEANPPAPPPPPGDGQPDAPRPPGSRARRNQGFSDNDSVVSPLSEAEDGDSDY